MVGNLLESSVGTSAGAARMSACATILLCSSLAFGDLIIRDATVIDVASGTRLPGRSILIVGEKIAEVGADIQAPKQAQVISGVGKYVIPGLWDMHVNLWDRAQLPLYAAYGVTGVRDMGSDFNRVRLWREEMQKGSLVGPHVETCGAVVDGFPSDDPRLPVRMAHDAKEARALYDQLDDQGVNFIGVLPRLPRDAYFALIERARKYYSAVAGPVPATVSVLEAIDARQRSIEHMSGILLACSSEEKRLRGPRALALDRRDWPAFQDLETAALESYNPKKAEVLFERMARYETRAVPTLVMLRTSPCAKGLYEKLTQLLIAMHRAGVAIMAGSDGGKPGEALHEELELLVAAGLTPVQALRSATLAPAIYLDAAESLGEVRPGRTADLVLLDADPLADIRNTRKIAGVVLAGKYLSKTRLTALKMRK